MRHRVRASVIAVAAIAVAGCAAVAPQRATPPPFIAVTGHGEVDVKPETVLVHLGAESRRPSLADATADVGGRMTEVAARLKALGIRPDDITTVQYSVSPVPSRQQPDSDAAAPEIAGYHVENIVRIRVRDLAAVGRVVDVAMAAGANAIRGIQFGLADPAAAKTAARNRAVDAVRAAAADLARAAGVQLGPLLSLREAGVVHAAGRGVSTAGFQIRGPGPIEAGDLTVSVTVEARYRIDAPSERVVADDLQRDRDAAVSAQRDREVAGPDPPQRDR